MGRLIRDLKTKFTAGEQDPKLAGRRDLKYFYDGAERMRNVFPIPQGGFTRRHGGKFIADVTTLNSGNAVTLGYRFIPFTVADDDAYMLLFLDQEFRVFKDGGSGYTQVHQETGTAWLGADVPKLDWAQELETLILAAEDYPQKSVVRASDVSWTIANISFPYVPQYQFTPGSSTPDATITPDAVEGTIKLTLVLTTFGGWTASHVNQKVEFAGGLARIKQVNSTTVAVAEVEIPFYNTDTVTATNWTLHTGYEDAWSGSKGYPAAVGFYGGRIFYGGGQIGDVVWGSRVGEFTDFEPRNGLADEPVTTTIAQGSAKQITHIEDVGALMIATTDGLFFTPQQSGVPIKPDNFTTRRASKRGAKAFVPVTILDDALLYVQKGGKTIRMVTADPLSVDQRFKADPLSLLASHLILNPSDMSLREASSQDEADMLFSAMSDGSLASATLMFSQDVIAFAKQTTEGTFLASGVLDEDVFVLVERTIDSVTKYFVEQLHPDHRMDASVRITSGLPTDTFTVAHLPNTTVHVRADDAYLGTFTTNGSGQVTISRNAETYVEIGLDFPSFTDERTGDVHVTPYVRDMPMEAPLPDGTTLGRKKRIVEVTTEVKDTQGFRVNGNAVSFRKFGPAGGGSPLDAAPPSFTGEKTIEGLLEYTEKGQVEIDQTEPLDMTILAYAKKVSV